METAGDKSNIIEIMNTHEREMENNLLSGRYINPQNIFSRIDLFIRTLATVEFIMWYII